MNDFFAPLYEGWGLFYLNNFSDDLYNNQLYLPIGWTLLLSTLGLMAVYYYLINHPRFNRWYHWLLYVGLVGLINFAVAYFVSHDEINMLYEEDPYRAQYYTFGLVNLLYAFVFCTIFSYIIRWWSINCATTPVPQ